MYDFKIGDRVVAVRPVGQNNRSYCYGVVHTIEEDHGMRYFGVVFDDDFIGHDLGDRLHNFNGWWCARETLKRVGGYLSFLEIVYEESDLYLTDSDLENHVQEAYNQMKAGKINFLSDISKEFWHLFPCLDRNEYSSLTFKKDWDDWDWQRRTKTKLGKGLRKFLPDLKDHELRDLVASVFAANAEYTHELYSGKDMVDKMWEIADLNPEPNGINHVWSCMTYTRYPDQIHPYEFYAQNKDIKLCLVYKGEELMGRTLIYYDKYVRIYSSREHEVSSYLEQQGYEHDYYALEGIEIPIIRGEDNNTIVVPYLDGDMRFDIDGDLITISIDGKHEQDSTNGLFELLMCGCCGKIIGDYDFVDAYGTPIGYCCSDGYVRAIDWYGDFEYVRLDNAIETENEDIFTDEDAATRFGYVLHEGKWIHNSSPLLAESEEE